MNYEKFSSFCCEPRRSITLLFVLILFVWIPAGGQNIGSTIVHGRVMDAVSHEPLPLVAIVFVKTNTGTTTDSNGYYRLNGKKNSNIVRFSCLGYKAVEVPVVTGLTQEVDIRLNPQPKTLNEVVAKSKKQRYRNKDNPAVGLINQVIRHKYLNRKEQLDTYSYEKYEKTQFALSNLTEEFKNRKSLRKYKFIFDHVDSTKIQGNEILPVYLKETLSDVYRRSSPKSEVEVIRANKMVMFEGYLDAPGMTKYLKYMYQDINIYNQYVQFLTNMFLSPVANTAPAFYRFFIMDTLMVDSSLCFKMLFAPRNKADLLFQGYLYITCDSSYAIKKIELSVPAEINLNWAKEASIVQNFNRIGNEGWMLTQDLISIDFGITKDKVGLYGERSSSYRNITCNRPVADSVFRLKNLPEQDSVELRDDGYWQSHRHQPLTTSESATYAMIDSLKHMPAFKNMINILFLIFTNYRDLGYFEIGPVTTFFSFNPVEGFRLRFGGRTTNKLSKRINFETYAAYGFYDTRIKYYLGTTISLTRRSIFEFPVKLIRTSYQVETKIPGQELQFVQESSFLLSIKRGINNKLFYNQVFRLEHLNEFPSHFSYYIGYQFLRQRPGGDLYFNCVDYLQKVNNPEYIDISELALTLRYAPNERFYQGKQYRVPMVNRYPIIQLALTYGSKFLQNNYDYLNVKLSLSKRFYLGVMGYSDMIWECGKIFGKVPYPLLYIHRANQSYAYQITSYNLMNFLEFVSDEYVSLNIDHCFNGFFFNKIPLFKKLKLREYIAAKILFGSLTPLNNPADNPDLFRFPVDDFGTPVTFTLNRGPYIEVSAGISNILKFFRIEFVKRVTYQYNPHVSNFGIRIRYKFDF